MRTRAASDSFLSVVQLVWWLVLLLGVVFCDGCIKVEREALLQFKRGLYDPEGKLDTWSASIDEEDCCKGWSGVGCDDQSGHVVDLDLRGMNLGVRGCENFDRPTLCHLMHLQRLDLSSNNFFNCTMPSFLDCFMNLRYLNLSISQFHGVVPSSLGNLSELVWLDLSENIPYLKIHDARWFRQLHSLEYIDMSWSQFENSSSHWIQSLNELPSLSTLVCSFCRFQTFPTSLMLHFPSLQTLVLRYCSLEGHFPTFIKSMLSLQKLDLSWNKFNGFIPFFIENLSSLRSLNLSGNKFRGFIPSSVENLSSLQSLDLSGNKFIGFIPSFIGNLSSLHKLDLSANNLKGSIPVSLGNLTSLHSLRLSSNEFNGYIPSFIANLSLLQYLDLHGNNFIGSIPNLGNLSSLLSLDLSSNKLNGFIPNFFENLSSLQILSLSSNKFNGSIPKSVCNLSSLKSLYLFGNDNINGVDFPTCFGRLSKLELLLLEGHGFILSESHFFNMSQLNSLSLKSNFSSTLNVSSNWIPPFSLSSLSIQKWRVKPNEFPAWIRTQEKLNGLVLQNVGITGNLPTWIWNFSSSLLTLLMTSNHMDGEIPDATNSNNTLNTIDLSSNKFEGNASYHPSFLYECIVELHNFCCPSPIQSFHGLIFLGSKWLSTISKMMPKLTYLSLSNNTNLFGGIPLLLCEMQDLEALDLSKNNFSGEIPDCLMRVKRVLHLGSNRFNNTIPKIRENQCTLESLHLENNELDGNLPSSLSKCRNLKVLDLHENKLTGLIPSWIAESMLSLKILSLRSNRLSGNILHSLSKLESLQVLDLGNNNLSGSIPTTIGDFKAMRVVHKSKESIISDTIITSIYYKEVVTINLKGGAYSYVNTMLSLVTSIDLSRNNLLGVIPQEFGDLLGLLNMNLSRNQLTSTIPKSLGQLLILETLDLSRNNLSGQIPQEMTKITALSQLNLSFNNLSGKIPTGKQFFTFQNESYIDNPNLCGPPLSKSCEEGNNPKSKGENKDDDDEKEKLWLYMTVVLGFIVGFWTFYGVLFFKKTWRYPYLQFLNYTSQMLYMMIIQPIKRMVK